jgi:hypothetical protein
MNKVSKKRQQSTADLQWLGNEITSIHWSGMQMEF